MGASISPYKYESSWLYKEEMGDYHFSFTYMNI